MSINDLMNDEGFFVVLFFVFVFVWIVLGPVRDYAKNKADKLFYGDEETGEYKEEKVTLIEKKTMQHPLSKREQVYIMLFETESKNRVELAIKLKHLDVYSLSTVGDKGILRYQGKNKFIEFIRNTDNEN